MSDISTIGTPRISKLFCNRNLAILLFAIVLPHVANAQSQDKASPTPLTSNEISSPINADDRNETVYYKFYAGPGEITVRLVVETAAANDAGINEVSVSLFTDEGKVLASLPLSVLRYPRQSPNWTARDGVQQIRLSRSQWVLMSVSFGNGNTPGGKYRVRLSGAVKTGPNAQSETNKVELPSTGDTYSDGNAILYGETNSEIQRLLPKEGTLSIKMKDGSIKKIDLNKVATVTVGP